MGAKGRPNGQLASNGSSDPKVIVMERKMKRFFAQKSGKTLACTLWHFFSFMCASIEIKKMCNNRAMYHVLLMNSE